MGSVLTAGRTPLHKAIDGNNVSEVACLLEISEGRAMMKAVDEEGFFPLHLAASLGETGIVRMLLDAGAPDVQRCPRLSIFGRFAVECAIHHNNEETAWVFVERYECNERSIEIGKSCIHDAAEKGMVRVVERLLKLGVPIETPGSYMLTPLVYAVFGGCEDMVSLLLSHGAPIHNSGEYGAKRSPLFYIQYGGYNIAWLLLHNPYDAKNRADPNVCFSSSKVVPLHCLTGMTASDLYLRGSLATVEERIKMIGLLCEAGAQREPYDHEGLTPLARACLAVSHDGDNWKIVEELMARGASDRLVASEGPCDEHLLWKADGWYAVAMGKIMKKINMLPLREVGVSPAMREHLYDSHMMFQKKKKVEGSSEKEVDRCSMR